jgi:hypothetical protein
MDNPRAKRACRRDIANYFPAAMGANNRRKIACYFLRVELRCVTHDNIGNEGFVICGHPIIAVGA